MIAFKIILFIELLVFYLLKTKKCLQVFQQSHYHYKSFRKIFKYYYLNKWFDLLLYLLLIGILFIELWYVQFFFDIVFLLLIIKNRRVKDIICLRFTARIIRNITINSLLICSFLVLGFVFEKVVQTTLVIVLLLPFILLLSSLTAQPIETLISRKYSRLAKRKIKSIAPIIIGITGSYGKTSIKNYLYEFLKEKYLTLATPKSYNTINGISITINNYLSNTDELLIAEMGASHVNDIRKLVNFLKPTYAIVCEIGPQHLETFKTIENIISEKMYLIDSLPANGVGIINIDNEYIRNYSLRNNTQIITIAIERMADYQAENIKINEQTMSFTIKHQNKCYDVETKVLGRHNIYNILIAFALADYLGVNKNILKNRIFDLENVKHRLTVYYKNGLKVIDDSYNSNMIGFKNALELLNLHHTKRIIITSGIVEAGIKEEEINKGLASHMNDVCDFIALIDSQTSKYILAGLIEKNCSKYKVFTTFNEAMNYVTENYKSGTVLIENDLPDYYFI